MYKILVTTTLQDTGSVNGKAVSVHTLVIDFPDEKSAVEANSLIGKNGYFDTQGKRHSILLFTPANKPA